MYAIVSRGGSAKQNGTNTHGGVGGLSSAELVRVDLLLSHPAGGIDSNKALAGVVWRYVGLAA